MGQRNLLVRARIALSERFKYSLSTAKRSLYRAANATRAKI